MHTVTRADKRNHPRRGVKTLLCLLGVSLVGACAQNPVTGDRDFVLMSEAQEKRMGARSHEALTQQMPPVDDDELQAYVDAIGQELAEASHRPDIDYTVTVVDNEQINAFALPGGYVYVTRGILTHFNSEAELAGVLGHEIGHVTARHGVRRHATASERFPERRGITTAGPATRCCRIAVRTLPGTKKDDASGPSRCLLTRQRSGGKTFKHSEGMRRLAHLFSGTNGYD